MNRAHPDPRQARHPASSGGCPPALPSRRHRAAAVFAAALLFAAAPPPAAAGDGGPRDAATLFAMPRIAEDIRRAEAHLRAGDRPGAGAILDALINRHPDFGLLRLHRAALALAEGRAEAALPDLEAAAAAGTPAPAAALQTVLAAPALAPLGRDPDAASRLAALRAAAPDPEHDPESEAPAPAPVTDGAARVSSANTAWNPTAQRLEARFALPPRPEHPAVAAGTGDETLAALRRLAETGRAAGNHGDLYDNRDRGHSTLDLSRFPQVTRVIYDEAARAAGIDYGLADRILFDRPTFGNSSTALTGGAHWRSQARHALTAPDGAGPARLWQNWEANHLYVYPAHHDWGGEAGDLFPANAPYLLVSRGSSGSDRPFLQAVATILAAFPPETKARLVEERLLVPAVQYVFRRSLRHVRSREAYMSADAHPPVFEAGTINLARAVALAQSIAPDALPPEARIAVLEEELGQEGIDFFGAGLGEALFDTPAAIGRLWRSVAGRRTMVVSAEASRDANGRPLAFHWRLLQGDPARVRIEPEDGGRRARITLDWHERFPVSAAGDQPTARVDIAVFAANGIHDSAPALLSWHFPRHETRAYETGADGAPRIAAIDHADPGRATVYADPLLWPRADWRDVYQYDESGRPAGWTRHRSGRTDAYGADGRRLLGAGVAEAVAYPLVAGPDGMSRVEEHSAR